MEVSISFILITMMLSLTAAVQAESEMNHGDPMQGMVMMDEAADELLAMQIHKNALLRAQRNQLHQRKDQLTDQLTQLLEQIQQLKQQIQAVSDSVDIVPTSCQQLQLIGYINNGFYLVQEISGIKILGRFRTVYCDFSLEPGTTGFETVMGYNDIKASPGVYFHVGRNGSFATTGTVIPWQFEQLNVGGGMNIATGVFTTPKAGRYYFSFSAHAQVANTVARMQLNGNVILSGFATGMGDNAPIQSTLNLVRGDQVSVLLERGSFYEDNLGETYFVGYLLEEDVNPFVLSTNNVQ